MVQQCTAETSAAPRVPAVHCVLQRRLRGARRTWQHSPWRPATPTAQRAPARPQRLRARGAARGGARGGVGLGGAFAAPGRLRGRGGAPLRAHADGTRKPGVQTMRASHPRQLARRCPPDAITACLCGSSTDSTSSTPSAASRPAPGSACAAPTMAPAPPAATSAVQASPLPTAKFLRPRIAGWYRSLTGEQSPVKLSFIFEYFRRCQRPGSCGWAVWHVGGCASWCS